MHRPQIKRNFRTTKRRQDSGDVRYLQVEGEAERNGLREAKKNRLGEKERRKT